MSLPNRFYVATRKDRSAQADALSDLLNAHGWERTFAWTDETDTEPEGFCRIYQPTVIEGARLKIR